MSTPVITIYVRHSVDCKYAGDEFCKRCRCRKHFRWTQNGVRHRESAGTRSWEEAENIKRRLEDQLAGRAPATPDTVRNIEDAIDLFIKDKRVQGVSSDVIGKYTREMARLRDFCAARNVYAVQGITRDLITEFAATWEAAYPSTYTRSKVRERLRSFLRYCYEAQWLPRVPQVPKISVDEPETQPLTSEEYERVLAVIPGTVQVTEKRLAKLGNLRAWAETRHTYEATPVKVRAFIQCMRWSGLAILDTLKLERANLQHDKARNVFRIVTKRTKTGTHVSVPIPPDVAQELLAVLNGNPKYIFWSGNGEPETATKNWAKRYIRLVFKAANIHSDGNMVSHRLRDTFAVDLLEKGVPLEEVSKLLGHTSIKTTERSYAKWSKGRQERADSLVMGTWSTQTQGG
jgi:integrase/recombinase XerD